MPVRVHADAHKIDAVRCSSCTSWPRWLRDNKQNFFAAKQRFSPFLLLTPATASKLWHFTWRRLRFIRPKSQPVRPPYSLSQTYCRRRGPGGTPDVSILPRTLNHGTSGYSVLGARPGAAAVATVCCGVEVIQRLDEGRHHRNPRGRTVTQRIAIQQPTFKEVVAHRLSPSLCCTKDGMRLQKST